MRSVAILSSAVASFAIASASLVERQSLATASPRPGNSEQSYISQVCSPANSGTGTIPPCISIQTIETQCAPNGTQPIDYLAHAECLCNTPSSFFVDWQACRRCLFVHGALNQNDLDTQSIIISSVSNALCTGTPTASFAALFTSVAAEVTPVTSAGSVSSDQYPSQTAVSLYYTATGSQGPGAITGSATAATRTGTGVVVGAGGVTVISGTNSVPSTRASGSGTSATTVKISGTSNSGTAVSTAGALPTAGMAKNFLAAVAGGAFLVAF